MSGMNQVERRAAFALAAIFGLRMFGLFVILPVFASFAATLPGGHDPFLAGLALGSFGITQALLHIPLGMLSDRVGRRPVIVAGLVIYAAGCLCAAGAPNIHILILGRVLQGMGAISAVVSALATDVTRAEQRTKVMAMIGSSIGLMFALALVTAPPLYSWLGMSGIFTGTALLALAAIALLYSAVPTVAPSRLQPVKLRLLLANPLLLRLNAGVFALHLMLTTLWLAVPQALLRSGLELGGHWQVYLPGLAISFAVMIPAIIYAERHHALQQASLAAVAALVVAQLAFAVGGTTWWLGGALAIFFCGFNLLEALQPSLLARSAPANARGAVMGVYNTVQSLGIACGGVLGGWLGKHYGSTSIYWLCIGIGLAWWWLLARSFWSGDKRQTSATQQ